MLVLHLEKSKLLGKNFVFTPSKTNFRVYINVTWLSDYKITD